MFYYGQSHRSMNKMMNLFKTGLHCNGLFDLYQERTCDQLRKSNTRLRKPLHTILSKKLGFIHSGKNNAYTAMNQSNGKFKKDCSRKFKVNVSILGYIYVFISQKLWSWKIHRNHRRTNAALMIHNMILDSMWQSNC